MFITNKLLVVRLIFSFVILLTSPICLSDAAQVSKELGRQLIHAEIIGKSEILERTKSSNRSSETQTLALNSNRLVSSRSRLDMQDLRFNQSQMLSRNMTRMQDLRFNQSQMLSRNMTRMQDLRFNQSQMLSRNMTRMQDLRFNQSQMLSRNMTRMQDLRFNQSQMLSRNMTRMQDLRFNQSQMLSRNMSRMQDLRFNQSQMLSRNMTRMQDLRFNQSQMLSRNMTRMQDLRFNQSQMLSRNMTRMQDIFSTQAMRSLPNPRDQFTRINAYKASVTAREWMIRAGSTFAGKLPSSMPLRQAKLSQRMKRVLGSYEPGTVLNFKFPQVARNNTDMPTSIKRAHKILKHNELKTIQRSMDKLRDQTHENPVFKYGNRQLGVVGGTYRWSVRKQYDSGNLKKYMSGRSITTIQRYNRHRIQAPVFDYKLWSRTRL